MLLVAGAATVAASGEEDRAPEDDRPTVASHGIDTIPAVDAGGLADAVQHDDLDLLRDATFLELPPKADKHGAHGVSTQQAIGFPTDGDTFAVFTNGQAQPFHHDRVWANAWLKGDHVRGEHDLDVTVLRMDLDVPAGADCLGLDYRFLTNEWIGSLFQDAFVLEVGDTSWTTEDYEIKAPDAIAVSSTRDPDLADEHGDGVAFQYGTPTKRVTTELPLSNPLLERFGAERSVSVYASVFDFDSIWLDSGAALDNLYLSSQEDGTCPEPTEPTAPRTLEARTGPGQGNVTLTWEAPADDGGLDLQTYHVYRARGSAELERVASTTDTRLEQTGLPDGATYRYVVTAENPVGESPRSATATATTLPAEPENLTAEPGTWNPAEARPPHRVVLDWDRPDDAGAEVLRYHVHREDQAYHATVPGDQTTYTDEDLPLRHDEAGSTYTYTVTAVNAGGEGPASQEASSPLIPPKTTLAGTGP